MTVKIKRPPQKTGPKEKLIITPQLIQEIEMLAGRGLTQQQMHEYYGVCSETWYRKIKQNPEMAEVIKKGKAKTMVLVVGKLMELVRNGNLGAIIFYLKTQHRWSEHSTVEVIGEEKKEIPALSLVVKDPIEAAKIYQKIMSGD